MTTYRILIGERIYEATITPSDQSESYFVQLGSQRFTVNTKPGLRQSQSADTSQAAKSDAITAKIPGRIVAVHVADGDTVQTGSKLLTVNSMKMDTLIEAPHAGTVASLTLQVGDMVTTDAVLLHVRPPDAP